MANARESEKREKRTIINKEEYKAINETMMTTQNDLDGDKTDEEDRDGWFKEWR